MRNMHVLTNQFRDVSSKTLRPAVVAPSVQGLTHNRLPSCRCQRILTVATTAEKATVKEESKPDSPAASGFRRNNPMSDKFEVPLTCTSMSR